MGAAELARNWLIESSIQDTSGEGCRAGGVNSWYDLDTGRYPHIYPESTGYAVTTFIYLNRLKRNAELIKKAKLAADWLIGYDMENGTVKTRDCYSEEKTGNGFTYAFDNGIVICGLANLYKETRDEKYLKAAEKIAEFVIGKMQKEDGSFYAIYDSQKDELIDTEEKWSTQSGSYHAKLAIGFLKLYDTTRNEKYKESAEAVCREALKMQLPEGRFVSHRDTKATHIHPHCYSAEGLLYAGLKLGNERFIEAAEKATKWAIDNLREDGGTNCLYNNCFEGCERSDTLAQVLRLGAVFWMMGKLSEDQLKKMEKLKDRLLSFQHMRGDQKGGFIYAEEDGVKVAHLNSWCTMFAIQALDYYYKAASGKKIDVELIV